MRNSSAGPDDYRAVRSPLVTRRSWRSAAPVALVATALVAAGVLVACGPSTQHHASPAHDQQADAMAMGNPDAPPADRVPGADLVRGPFRLLDTAPEGYSELTGEAMLARHDGGTTVTVELQGLQPHQDYISHVHQGSCATGGGPHYKFDPAGGDMPPNEIHLAFTSTADGSGFMTAENDRTAGAAARSVVVHPREFVDNRLACADLS